MVSLESYKIGSARLLNGMVSKLLFQPFKFGVIMVEWREIKRFKRYDVSNDGRVRSWVSGSPKLLSRQTTKLGYKSIGLRLNKKMVVRFVHVLVLEAFVGLRPKGYQTCHNNGVRDDNRLENLRWDTVKNNQLDKIKHGTIARGERDASAKLKEWQVIDIRKAHKENVSVNELAEIYPISKGHIRKIINGDCWKHLLTKLKGAS